MFSPMISVGQKCGDFVVFLRRSDDGGRTLGATTHTNQPISQSAINPLSTDPSTTKSGRLDPILTRIRLTTFLLGLLALGPGSTTLVRNPSCCFSGSGGSTRHRKKTKRSFTTPRDKTERSGRDANRWIRRARKHGVDAGRDELGYQGEFVGRRSCRIVPGEGYALRAISLGVVDPRARERRSSRTHRPRAAGASLPRLCCCRLRLYHKQ